MSFIQSKDKIIFSYRFLPLKNQTQIVINFLLSDQNQLGIPGQFAGNGLGSLGFQNPNLLGANQFGANPGLLGKCES